MVIPIILRKYSPKGFQVELYIGFILRCQKRADLTNKLENQFLEAFDLRDLSVKFPNFFKGLTRPHRTIKDLLREFNDEKYGSKLSNKTNNDFSGSNLSSEQERLVNTYFDGKLFLKANLGTITNSYHKSILEKLGAYLPQVQNIVDLGCGTGEMLVSVHNDYPGKKYFGGDISQNALLLTEERKTQCNLMLETFQFDLNNFNAQEFKFIDDALVYTSCVMMYSSPDTSSFLKNLILARPKFIVFIEPLTEHFSELGIWGLWAHEYFNYNLYSDLWDSTFVNIILTSKLYQLVEEHKNFFAPNPLLPITIKVYSRI